MSFGSRDRDAASQPAATPESGTVLSVAAVGPALGGVGDSFRQTAATLAGDDRVRLTTDRVPEASLSALSAARWLLRRRRRLRSADVVHIEFGTNDRTTFWVALLTTLMRARVLLVIHDFPQFAKNPAVGILGDGTRWTTVAGHRLLSPLLDRVLGMALLRRADAVAVMSREAQDGLAPRARAGRHLIPHGSVRRSARPVPPSAGTYALFAGYLGPAKGVDVLLRAWIALPDPASELWIAADPPGVDDTAFAELYRAAAAGPRPPRWIGFQATEEALQDLIAQAAVVVLPYRRAAPGSGMLARAMSEGRPILASGVPTMQAAIRSGREGLLVPPDDPVALSSALAEVLGDGGLRDRLGAAAAARAGELFSSGRQADILIGAYQDLVGRPGRQPT